MGLTPEERLAALSPEDRETFVINYVGGTAIASNLTTDHARPMLRAYVAAAAEQAERPWFGCTGASTCGEAWHVHGCYADDGQCDDPLDHHKPIAEQARAEVVAAVERVPATHMLVGHRGYWMVDQAALRAALSSEPTPDAITEPRVCDHKYPPEREDGTCPSCDKRRAALATED
jgi:hypothetical protein